MRRLLVIALLLVGCVAKMDPRCLDEELEPIGLHQPIDLRRGYWVCLDPMGYLRAGAYESCTQELYGLRTLTVPARAGAQLYFPPLEDGPERAWMLFSCAGPHAEQHGPFEVLLR